VFSDYAAGSLSAEFSDPLADLGREETRTRRSDVESSRMESSVRDGVAADRLSEQKMFRTENFSTEL
jgi:hypothetical protein